MAWEQRGNGTYYYRKRREEGRVVSEYVGTGPRAVCLAEIDAGRRAEREALREAERREREALRETDRQFDAAGDLIRALMRGALLATGYHTHKRQWRKLNE